MRMRPLVSGSRVLRTSPETIGDAVRPGRVRRPSPKAIHDVPRRSRAHPVRERAGADVGFKVTGTDLRTGLPTGVWVVRMQGKWVEVTSEPAIRPAK